MVLVTGATGLVGAHLLLHLSQNETTIRAIYRNPKNIEKTKALFHLYSKGILFDNIQWIQADILDIPSLEIAFQDIDYVYHCAACISFNPSDENQLRNVNIQGTANIVNFCIDKKVQKLCHVSSIAALGDLAPHEKILTETTEWNPEKLHSDYAISKYGAEMEVWRGQQEGLQVVIVNPGVIFGAGFWHQGSGAFFTSVQKGFPFYTKGSSGYVSVTDVVKIMQQLMQSEICGERFIVISENINYKDILFSIADKIDAKKPTIEAKPWLLNIAWRMDWLLSKVIRTERKISKYAAQSLQNTDRISNEKVITTLNYHFKTIEETLNEVVVFFKKSI